MREIQLDKGMRTIVDDQDYEWLSMYKWRAHKPSGKNKGSFYAIRGREGVAMHRVIVDCPKGMCVDHINGNSLDNRRCNLRICSGHENIMNRKAVVTKRSKSKFLGVDLNRSGKKWISRIGLNRKKFHLGTFDSEEEAARMYDMHAKAAFGEYANLNFKGDIYAGNI